MSAQTYDLAAAITRREQRRGVFGVGADFDPDLRDWFYDRETKRIARLSPVEIDAEIAEARGLTATPTGGAGGASPVDVSAEPDAEPCPPCDRCGDTGIVECSGCADCLVGGSEAQRFGGRGKSCDRRCDCGAGEES